MTETAKSQDDVMGQEWTAQSAVARLAAAMVGPVRYTQHAHNNSLFDMTDKLHRGLKETGAVIVEAAEVAAVSKLLLAERCRRDAVEAAQAVEFASDEDEDDLKYAAGLYARTLAELRDEITPYDLARLAALVARAGKP